MSGAQAGGRQPRRAIGRRAVLVPVLAGVIMAPWAHAPATSDAGGVSRSVDPGATVSSRTSSTSIVPVNASGP